MCANTPLKIIKIEKDIAITKDGRKVKLLLTPTAKVGDYISVNANIALEIIPKNNALAQIKERKNNK